MIGVVILAAGKGTRMKSDLAKVLHKVADKSMVNHVVGRALKISKENVCVVVGHQAEDVKKEVDKFFSVDFAIQRRLLGTGDAVKAAIPRLKSCVKTVLVLCGDVPLIQEETLQKLVDGHTTIAAGITVLATQVDDPKGYGRIIFDNDNNLMSIREEADASAEEKKITIVNTGIYCFDKALLVSALHELKPDNRQAEYYLTDVIEIAQKRNERIGVVVMDNPREVIGVNTLEDLAKAEGLLRSFSK